MTEPLHVQTDGLLSNSQVHADVVTGMSGLVGDGAPDSAGVHTSHGTVSSEVTTALSSALSGRGEVFGAVSDTAGKFSERLQQAAKAYAEGDQQGAERIKAAQEGTDTAGSDGGGRRGGGPAGGGSSPGTPGGEMMGQMGQMLGQVGQQVGQMAQSISAPLQGLTQGLQQIPQQVMQAVQQGAQATAATGQGKADTQEGKSQNGPHDTKAEDRKKITDAKHPRSAPQEKGQVQAAQGSSPSAGRAPVEPTPHPARPAPTRTPID
jgi:hypothetical protein